MGTLEIPACRLSPDTSFAYVNACFARAFGRPADSFLGAPLARHMPPLYHDTLRKLTLLTPEHPKQTLRFPLLDDREEECWCTWDCRGNFNDDGTLRDIVVFGREIAAELRYRNNLEQLQKIANDPSLDYVQRVVGMLSTSNRFFGTTGAAILNRDMEGDNRIHIGLTAGDLAWTMEPQPAERTVFGALERSGPTIAIHDIAATPHADLAEHLTAGFGCVLASTLVQGGQRSGAVIFASATPRSRAFTHQEVQFSQIVAQWLSFIMEQHTHLTSLQNREAKYKHIFKHSPVMFYMTDPSNIITDVNNNWLRTLNYQKDQVIGHPISKFQVPPEERTAEDRVDAEAARNLHQFIASDGNIIEALVSVPEGGRAGLPELAVMVDVTERNRVLRELTDIRKTLTLANEGLKRFNTIAAHDLQEPLRKIRLFGNLLKSALDDNVDPEVELAIDRIIDAANRLTTLVKDLLLYSREGERAYDCQPVDLGSLIKEALEDLAISISETGAGISVDPLPPVKADPVPVQRMFTNLILNALKYRDDRRRPEIHIFSRRDEQGRREIVIRDNGVGLRKEDEEKIFAPFVRVQPRKSSGSGIGLAICRSIASGHGWTLRAEGRGAAGTDFIIGLGAEAETAEDRP